MEIHKYAEPLVGLVWLGLKWVTREKAKVDRIACPWLISRFVDRGAQFLFVKSDQVSATAAKEGATAFDAPGAELTHFKENGMERVTFDAVIKKYGLTDPALMDLAEIVRGADTTLTAPRPESAGLEAIAIGFREIARDDHENMSLQFPVYDALYRYCQLRMQGKAKLEHSV